MGKRLLQTNLVNDDIQYVVWKKQMNQSDILKYALVGVIAGVVVNYPEILIPLLDKEKLKQENKRLKEKIKQLKKRWK